MSDRSPRRVQACPLVPDQALLRRTAEALEEAAVRRVAAAEADARALALVRVLLRYAPAAAQAQPASPPEWTTLERAAAECRVHIQTMRARVVAHGLGFKVGGTWRVDLARVRAFEAGAPFAPVGSEAQAE